MKKGVKGFLGAHLLAGFILLVGVSKAHSANLYFTRNVTPEQKKIILADLQYLKNGRLSDPSGEMLRIMKLKQVSGTELDSWLSKRMRFILDQDYPIDNTVIETQMENLTYPQLVRTQANSNIGLMMTNVGAAIYSAGKEAKELYQLQLDGIGKVIVSSPRVGIFKVGESFFSRILDQTKFSSATAKLVESVYRLGTLFHEARHSDGNNSSLGFFHTICPKGHPYEGIYACDTPSNGSYRVGALIADSVLNGCEKCTEGQKDALKVIRNDSLVRILSGYKTQGLKTASKLCEMEVFSEKKCTDKQNPVIEWNDQPERVQWK